MNITKIIKVSFGCIGVGALVGGMSSTSDVVSGMFFIGAVGFALLPNFVPDFKTDVKPRIVPPVVQPPIQDVPPEKPEKVEEVKEVKKKVEVKEPEEKVEVKEPKPQIEHKCPYRGCKISFPEKDDLMNHISEVHLG